MRPCDFWELTPDEFWLLHDHKMGQVRIGKLSLTEAERLLNNLEQAEEKWQSVH